jgi:NitT/TauT family transport system substrate-binding protein
MRGPRFYTVPLFVAAALALAGVSACSSSSGATTPSSGSGSKPEITNVTVGALAIPDAVTLRIAQTEGYFKQQGLNVKIQTLQASSFTTPLLLSHQLDFTSENYVGMLSQEEETPALNLKVLVDDG